MIAAEPSAAARLLGVRVTGTLVADAQLRPTTGREPHALLLLTVQPPQGLPYRAQIDLGTDLTEHMRVEQLLLALRQGALVSINGMGAGADRTDHGHAVHTLSAAHGLIVVGGAPTHIRNQQHALR